MMFFSLQVIVGSLLALFLFGQDVSAEVGFVGYGRSMYGGFNCESACRAVVSAAPLTCSKKADTGSHSKRATAAKFTTSPECYASNMPFLQTLAWCIHEHCLDHEVWQIEEFWFQYAAGDPLSTDVRTNITYGTALSQVKEAPKKLISKAQTMNTTGAVNETDFIGNFNFRNRYEEVETHTTTYALVVICSGLVIPVAFSLLRLVPFPGRLVAKVDSYLIQPALWGTRHKEPMPYLMGLKPTRGQTLFISYIFLINLLFCAVDYHAILPNSKWTTDYQIKRYFGNRIGTMSMANMVVMILYSSRNNFLLRITNWSHSTFLLAHRWIGFIAILQGLVHGLFWFGEYIRRHSLANEEEEEWWRWGAVAVCAMALILPTSSYAVRQKAYELFLISHIILVAIVILGVFFHMFHMFGGYENTRGLANYMYMAGALWGFDRLARLVRVGRVGLKHATITTVDDEYVRVDVPGVSSEGHAYLYFPTLTWRVWENHPFSVASAVAVPTELRYGKFSQRTSSSSLQEKDVEKSGALGSSSVVASKEFGVMTPRESDSITQEPSSFAKAHAAKRLTFFIRMQSGITGLTAKLAAHKSLPVLVEAGYGAHPDLHMHPNVICIAGGAGISTVLPIIQSHIGRVKLYWGVRSSSLVDTLGEDLVGVDKVISVGQRLNLRDILEEELGTAPEDPAVIVSGPAGMSDEVRALVCEIGRRKGSRPVKLIDESFGW